MRSSYEGDIWGHFFTTNAQTTDSFNLVGPVKKQTPNI